MAARLVSSFYALQSNGQRSTRPALQVDTQGVRLSADDENKVHGFKFLGLHPEVRNMIYGFSAVNANAEQATPNGVSLSDHTIPPITLTSSLLHQEAIPIFYEQTKFFVNVDANLVDRRNRRMYGALWPSVLPSRQARSGLLRTKAPLKKIIRGLGNAALIRDVTLRISSSQHGRVHQRNAPDDQVVSTIRFQTRSRTGGGNRLQMTVRLGAFHPSNTARFPHAFTGHFDIRDISTASQNAVQVARGISSQAGFHELTLGNCESLLRKLRSV